MKETIKRIAINLLILWILYCNVCGMLLSWNVRFDSSLLVGNRYVANLFYIYGVFLEIHMLSREYVAVGSGKKLENPPDVPNGELVNLDLYGYFPQSHGEANQRLFFTGYTNQPERRKESYDKLAEIVKRLHNEKRPGDPVEQVFIYSYSWPADPDGYYYRSGEATVILLGQSN